MAKMSGISSLSGGPTLMPTGPEKTIRRLGRHFGGDPASDRAADKVDAVEFQDVHQFEIKMGNVVDTVEPIRQARLAEARMRRCDEAAFFGQRRHEWLLRSETSTTVQKQNGPRRPLAGIEQFKLDVRDLQL